MRRILAISLAASLTVVASAHAATSDTLDDATGFITTQFTSNKYIKSDTGDGEAVTVLICAFGETVRVQTENTAESEYTANGIVLLGDGNHCQAFRSNEILVTTAADRATIKWKVIS